MRYVTIALSLLLAGQSPAPADKVPLERIKLPPGFVIDVYASGVKNARQMALGDKGTLFVGSREAGLVHAVVDTDGDHKADRVHQIASGLYMPSGVAFRNGSLYVAEVSRVIRFDDIESRLENPPPGVGGLPRRVYTPTPFGREVLAAWITAASRLRVRFAR